MTSLEELAFQGMFSLPVADMEPFWSREDASGWTWANRATFCRVGTTSTTT